MWPNLQETEEILNGKLHFLGSVSIIKKTFVYSKSTIEILEQGVWYVQSELWR